MTDPLMFCQMSFLDVNQIFRRSPQTAFQTVSSLLETFLGGKQEETIFIIIEYARISLVQIHPEQEKSDIETLGFHPPLDFIEAHPSSMTQHNCPSSPIASKTSHSFLC